METLTLTEKKVYELMSLGISAKEIAEILDSSVHTVHIHIKNIKDKIGLYKSTELVAFYYCHKTGRSFKEHKREILAGLTAIAMIFSIGSFEHQRYFRVHRTQCRITCIRRV